MANFSKLGQCAVATGLLATLANSMPNTFEFIKRAMGDDGHDHFPLPECPAYTVYSAEPHGPYSSGPLKLPFQRPEDKCRTFKSDLIENVINEFNDRLEDPDMARLFENCFPSTVDTTIRWHTQDQDGKGPRSFIITGDINAEWLRDSRNQVVNYQKLAPFDKNIRALLEGAIHTQAEYVIKQPYCNAFQPPAASGLKPADNEQKDTVKPEIDPKVVFECKYELDSIAAFLGIGNDFYEATGSTSFIDDEWVQAVETVYQTMKDQQVSTFSANGSVNTPFYTFQRETDIGTETLPLAGAGNPTNNNTNLVRSAFRPSDDATIFQFFIPANAMASVELKKTGKMLSKISDHKDLGKKLSDLSKDIEKSIWKYGTTNHPDFGHVFSFEVDGYGSHNNMDDANSPSLLALPDMGFVDVNDKTYQNTRRMILSKAGNPYFLEGPYFSGVGGPHIGTRNAWPMSHFVQIRTSDDDDEIRRHLEILKNSTDGLGLMHESIVVDQKPQTKDSYTRPWFAWANTEFAQTLLDLAERKPYLIFKTDKADKLSLQDLAKQSQKNSN